MSVLQINLSFLSNRPSVKISAGKLVVRTGFPQELITAFLDVKRLTVIPRKRQVFYTRRLFYFKRINMSASFDEISRIDYGFSSTGTDWGWSNSIMGRQDQLESFGISLIMKDGRRFPVCAFQGEGAVCTGWIGVLAGDDSIVDFSGTQEVDSRAFANMLSRILGVPLGRPYISEDLFTKCQHCGHPTTRAKPACLYCGKPVSVA